MEREDARKRNGGHIDLYLPDRYFTTFIDGDGNEKLVFSFTGKDKAISESNSSEGNIFLTYSSELVPELKAARRNRAKSSHAEGKKEPAAAAASGWGYDEKAPATREGMTRLPMLEVIKFLSRDPSSIVRCNVEALCRLALEEQPGMPEEVLRMKAESFNKQRRDQFVAFQNWVLAEHEEKGYVEVPDEFIKETEEARKQQGEEIDLHVSDRHFTTVVDDDGAEIVTFCCFRTYELVWRLLPSCGRSCPMLSD